MDAGPGWVTAARACSRGSTAKTAGMIAIAASSDAALFPTPVEREKWIRFCRRRAYAA